MSNIKVYYFDKIIDSLSFDNYKNLQESINKEKKTQDNNLYLYLYDSKKGGIIQITENTFLDFQKRKNDFNFGFLSIIQFEEPEPQPKKLDEMISIMDNCEKYLYNIETTNRIQKQRPSSVTPSNPGFRSNNLTKTQVPSANFNCGSNHNSGLGVDGKKIEANKELKPRTIRPIIKEKEKEIPNITVRHQNKHQNIISSFINKPEDKMFNISSNELKDFTSQKQQVQQIQQVVLQNQQVNQQVQQIQQVHQNQQSRQNPRNIQKNDAKNRSCSVKMPEYRFENTLMKSHINIDQSSSVSKPDYRFENPLINYHINIDKLNSNNTGNIDFTVRIQNLRDVPILSQTKIVFEEVGSKFRTFCSCLGKDIGKKETIEILIKNFAIIKRKDNKISFNFFLESEDGKRVPYMSIGKLEVHIIVPT